ncbi:semaphorin-5A-like [Uloborus diversus]|uniref:semaphorin-5A-like n=1 Tax=Uloborus diversus TaxID=327109 RepID=UPI00240A89E3|nr:semaphorin-5A-like [Uloborus diversus]
MTKTMLFPYAAFFCCLWTLASTDVKLITREDLKPSIDVFTQGNVRSFGQLLFDIQRYQLIVGARDYLFRLSLEGLKRLEEAHWPADSQNVTTCLLKGKSEEDCRNYIKVLVSHGGKLFTCGTNAFMPECSWREINPVRTVVQWVDGTAKCPYSPYANNTALMTSSGDYYTASTIDFSGRDPVIYKIMGKPPFLRTVQFDPKWLSDANFVSSFDIGNFTYFFFREAAVEYMNCGKVVYSRVARICKNDQGGQFLLKDKFTTFLKARLNCSIPGNYPFYYDEIQSVHYVEREDIFYATFTTPVNSIYGTAVCVYNMSSILASFSGAFKFQSNPKAAWERQTSAHKHFQCENPGHHEQFLDSEKYQLMNDAVQPTTSRPLLTLELQRFSQIVVDSIQTKDHDSVHVMFVASVEGILWKLLVVPHSQETCVIEKIKIFEDGSQDSIKVLKLLKDTNSLYIGTEESVLRIPVHRCGRFHTKSDCLSARDPYCGWNEYKLACTTAPSRNPLSAFWHQEKTTCPSTDIPVDGGWSSWSTWSECSQMENMGLGDRCMCQTRACNNPSPSNEGKGCEGTSVNVANCTRNGQWTEWSSWSSCSHSCGLAVKSRRRVCGNPAPAFGGKICIGPEKDEIYCTSNPPCPAPVIPAVDGHWSEWSTWEACSAPCGGGVQFRRRRCNSPPPGQGGRECLGCSQDFRFCNDQPCPEVRKSSAWTPFLRANRTREGHFEQRFRFTCKAHVQDEALLKAVHLRREERFCREGTQDCLDSTFGNVDGDWSQWSSWSPCSSSCGGGVQYRERACDNPKPSGTGADCSGPSRLDRVCNTDPCIDVEGWEDWSVWSLCDINQEQYRKRKCKLPQSAARYCTGSTKEIRMCIPGQSGSLSTAEVRAPEDGIHAAHVVGAFTCGLIVGTLLSALGIYYYMKRRARGGNRAHTRVARQLIPVKSNTYVDGNEWQNNFSGKMSPQKIPLREATIKRNGTLRAQLTTEHF